MAASSSKAVFLALIGNTFLTAIKLVAFVVSGSGAMLSEAIHSAADTGNQGLLYLGIRRSARPADAMFHYGYGGERFLFALLSAIGIFVLGCGVTVYHGIATLIHPPELNVGWVTWLVLAIAFVVDGYVLAVAIRAVDEQRGGQPFWRFIRSSSDPTILAVLFEDFVAALGVLVAAAGILLAQLTGNTVFDALSSIVIGLLLGLIAVWLGWRNRTLILGPAIPPDVEAGVVELLRAQPSVNSVRDIKSRVLAADKFQLKAEVDYDGRHLAREHLAWARAQRAKLSDDASLDAFALELGERVLDSLGREIDRIEREIAQRYPQLRHLDLEADWKPDD
jgi:zinc transporter 9